MQLWHPTMNYRERYRDRAIRPPGMKNTKHTDLSIPNNGNDKSSEPVEGSICKMEMIKLSVKDYMSSLHNYIETFSTPKSDGSIQTSPSVPTSISDMLKLCEADPVDLLIDLGFGIDEPDICNKIPSRFIMTPSEARGINTRVFLEAQKKRMEIENPNLCGRFRQLEVLEQVTSAFSSLLNNLHTTQNNGGQKTNSERKSTLTPEKRRRIQQLLWKLSKQMKIADENVNPTITKSQPELPKQDQTHTGPLKEFSNLKVFRKRKHCTDETGLETLSNGCNVNVLSKEQESEACSLSTSMTQSINLNMAGKIRTLKGSNVLSKTIKKTAQQRLQAKDPESFEMEEVLSFEEDCPRAVKQDSISVMTRANSCQSDSSGFQEEPPEPLPLQNLHESSDSNDSQTTLREKADVSIFNNESEEFNDICDFTEHLDTCENTVISGLKALKEKLKSLSMDTEKSDVFQSFDSQTDNVDKDDMQEIESQEPSSRATRNEEYVDTDSSLLQYELIGSISQDQAQSPEVPSEVDFPIYVPHYISDIIPESPGEINDSLMPDISEECVSDLQKSDSDRDSFADDECSVELSNLKWTPSPTSDLHSFGFHVHTPEGSVDYSDEELNSISKDKKSTYQTELNTNIYKSVTIQMSSTWLQDANDGLNRPNTVINTKTNRSELHALLKCSIERKEAFSQTDTGWWNECYTNNHCSHPRSCYLTESLSFDTALGGPNHFLHSPLSSHCCYCCHCHHCCAPRRHRHNASMRPSAYINLEKELSDTLKLLRESLIVISLNTDQDVENMKKACQKYREKLIDIEQCLTEQQAGCYNIFTSEERENMRRLHLLRQNVLKEALELEYNLDARARQVKETISMQLEEVLEEQSRLYSELEFYTWEQDRNPVEHNESLHRTNSLPSTSSCAVHKEDQGTQVNQGASITQSQKIDFSTIIQNIKKTLQSFKNS
ncbi:protein ITPRID1 isoform X2 [Ranitomeya imitator]|uniref:protein ITPRID1 isoform X2 n=1 Tax=Ranitomeya imitator TaxID=111125 RepID=UPI0037E75449